MSTLETDSWAKKIIEDIKKNMVIKDEFDEIILNKLLEDSNENMIEELFELFINNYGVKK